RYQKYINIVSSFRQPMTNPRIDRIYDFTIIGAGIVGTAIARELSRYKLRILVLEQSSDVASDITKANSGVIHAGFNNKPGSLKAKFCVEGNKLYPKLCSELNVPMDYVGKLVVAKNTSQLKALENLYARGKANKVPKLKMIYDSKQITKMEPNISAKAALYSGTSGVVQPWQLCIALAENAIENGVEIVLNTEVVDIIQKRGYFQIKTPKRSFSSKWAINCAGLGSARISKMVGIAKYKIYPCRGEYLILDKNYSKLINRLIYPAPSHKFGLLGVHLTPTLEGVFLIGPSAEFINKITDTGNTQEVMARLLAEANDHFNAKSPKLDKNAVIATFAGVRPKLVSSADNWSDFIVHEELKVPRFVNLVGIESPGLTAAPAIAEFVVNIIKGTQKLRPDPKFKPVHRGFIRFDNMNHAQQSQLIETQPDHGKIVCRCEFVTKREVLNALENPLGVKTIHGIKFRTRATMGRCQGGFCGPKLVEILEEEYQLPIEDITLKGGKSQLFVGKTKRIK
ncbi:MAG: NAD(P)/FAD-dependent oxidoreductase, partial [Thermoplasmata archaeon]|nr:NAD(P)/FAD-dependent oxidoreductase [Thermoplasmata archaeon]